MSAKFKMLVLDDDPSKGSFYFGGVCLSILQFAVLGVLALKKGAASLAKFLLPGRYLAGMHLVGGGDLIDAAQFPERFQGHLELELWR